MRSELIFEALAREPNRYLLCRLVAKGTRSLHRPNTRVQDTTNEMLEFFSVHVATRKTLVIGKALELNQRAA
jgi:hypothetical protein